MTFSEIPASWPILATLQLLPFITGLLLLKLRGYPAATVAAIMALVELFLSAQLYLGFDTTQPYGVMQFAEHVPLLGAIHYHAAVDGMSVLFVLLTSLIGFLGVVFIVFRNLQHSSVLALMMITQAALVSQFVTVDLLWFALLSIVEIIMIMLLTKRWPTYDDINPTLVRYLQFMSTGLLLFILGVVALGWVHADAHNGQWAFSLYDLVGLDIPAEPQVLIFFALFYGLAVRIPIFPLHGWLSDFMLHGNIAVAPMYLLGLKVGVYGLLRFVFPITPEAVQEWHMIAIGFAFVGIFYAAVLAIRQRTLRELLAFAVISHTGLLTIGLFSLHPLAFEGSLMLAINFGLALSGLLLMTGLLWQRTRTTTLKKLGGMLDYIPLVGVAFLIAGLAIIGMPGTPGFDAVHLVLEASIHRFGALLSIAGALGNIIAAGFLLHAFQRAFLSKPEGNTKHWDTRPAQITETILASTVILVIVTIGFYNEPWLKLIEQPMMGLSKIFGAGTH